MAEAPLPIEVDASPPTYLGFSEYCDTGFCGRCCSALEDPRATDATPPHSSPASKHQGLMRLRQIQTLIRLQRLVRFSRKGGRSAGASSKSSKVGSHSDEGEAIDSSGNCIRLPLPRRAILSGVVVAHNGASTNEHFGAKRPWYNACLRGRLRSATCMANEPTASSS